MTPVGELLREGEAALGRGDWAAARTAYTAAVGQEQSPEALHGLARAVEWAGDLDAATRLYERAFVAYRQRGEVRVPALIAGRELSFLYAAVHGNAAAADGWLARAQRLAQEAGDCPEHGWVDLAAALATEDPDAKEPYVRAALDTARRFGDTDLEFCALSYEGLVLVLRGQVAQGMRRIDEAAAAASGGEVRDYVAAGEIYCKMLLCCELALDVRRAQQWVAVATALGRDANALWVSAICRMHYGGILTAAGRWAEAEAELSASQRLYVDSIPAERPGAIARLADLRLRQGRFEEASRLLSACAPDAAAVVPLARLHLVRGELDVAAAVLRRSLRGQRVGVLHAPALAVLAEVEVARGRFDAARELCDELDGLAARSDLPHVRALAAYAAGVACAAAGEPAALEHLEAALAGFTAAGLPLEEARTRLALARVLAGTDPEVAEADARAALAAFRRLDAAHDADAAAGVLRRLGGRPPPQPGTGGPLTRRQSEVLGLMAEGLSNGQIAQRLFISKRTVEHHVGAILATLGVTTRAEALAYAARAGR